MMCTGKVSIVVPVYNVESYLPECIESLINQSYQDIEIILVDDSSTDDSLAICRIYEKKDRRIRVYHKDNGGAASARNYGLDRVNGEFICLVDSDDFVSQDYVSKLLERLKSTGSDIAVCSYVQLYKNAKVKNPYTYPVTTMSQIEYLERFLSDWTCGIAWNKMFKYELIEGIRYTEGHKIDDEFFTYLAVMNCKQVSIFSEELYYYRMRASSVMSNAEKYQKEMLMDKVEYSVVRYENVKRAYPILQEKYLNDLLDRMITYRREGSLFPEESGRIKRTMRNYCLEILKSKLDWKLKAAYLYNLMFPTTAQQGNATSAHHADAYYKCFM